MGHFQRMFPFPKVHRDEDSLHLISTLNTECVQVLFINNMQACVALLNINFNNHIGIQIVINYLHQCVYYYTLYLSFVINKLLGLMKM